ncbi:MAG: YvaD family protein [Alkaliphilus sp.]|nr:YvaD family protein [Alkaliphilus sp.]
MKIYKLILGFMGFGYISYWILALLGVIPIEYSNANEFAYEWSFAVIDILIGLMNLTSLFMYLRKNLYWKIMLTITLSVSVGINFHTMIYWVILKNFSNPMWFIAMWVFSYSLIGLILISKEKINGEYSV